LNETPSSGGIDGGREKAGAAGGKKAGALSFWRNAQQENGERRPTVGDKTAVHRTAAREEMTAEEKNAKKRVLDQGRVRHKKKKRENRKINAIEEKKEKIK